MEPEEDKTRRICVSEELDGLKRRTENRRQAKPKGQSCQEKLQTELFFTQLLRVSQIEIF